MFRSTAVPVVQSGLDVSRLIVRYGGPVGSALLDPACALYQADGIEGIIGYRLGLDCAVAIGEPVCAPDHMPALADAFRAHCRARGWHTTYAVVGPRFAEIARARGYASVEFGEELILDPRRDPEAGPRGREVRKKAAHARRAGLVVEEYARSDDEDAGLEGAMEEVAASWLGARKGMQIYLAKVRLFARPFGKRWFYARAGERVAGVLSTLRLDAYGGHLLDHLLAAPDAPSGTTELLVVSALAALRAEGCSFATFGPAPRAELEDIRNLSPFSEKVARSLFSAANELFHLDSRARYRRKFQVARAEPAYLLFDPPRLGLRQMLGLSRAFNVSLA